jgi:hypothetical protein
VNPDLADVLREYGIDPAAAASPGKTADVLDEPMVYLGGRAPRSPRQGDRPYYQKPEKVTITQANANLYKLTDAQIGQFQERIISAGIADPKKIIPGFPDDETVGAWVKLNEDSAKFLLAGRNVTPDDVLDMIGQANPQAVTGAAAAGGGFVDPLLDIAQQQRRTMLGFDTNLNQYRRSDPANIRVTAEQAFQKAIGRKPRKNEMDRFLNAFMVAEKSAQETVFSASDALEGEARGRAIEAASMVPVAAGGGATGSGNEADMLWARLQQMIADAPGKITPGPRTRSYAEQVAAKERERRGGPRAATPGKSKHGNGRANDLTYENDAVRRWALANAGRYGLAFPIYDPNLPRRLDESWHIELASSGGDSYGGAPAVTPSAGGPVTPAPISQNVTAQAVDPGARALEFARSQNPVETRAYDIGQQFNSFLAILQRGIGL